MIYGTAAVLSLLVLVGYLCAVRKKDGLFVLLFSSVLVVNIGYYALSVSGTLDQALWANRVAYLGSVFLPAVMLLIILGATNVDYPKWLPALLAGIGAVVLERLSKDSKKKFQLAQVLASVALVIGMFNAFM